MEVKQADKNKPQMLDVNHNITLLFPLATLRFQRPDAQHMVFCLYGVMPPHQFNSTILAQSVIRHGAKSKFSKITSCLRAMLKLWWWHVQYSENIYTKIEHCYKVTDTGSLMQGETRCLVTSQTIIHTRAQQKDKNKISTADGLCLSTCLMKWLKCSSKHR